jgi:hypothetical protein
VPSLARILLRAVAGAAVLGVPACGGGGGAGGASSDFSAISVSLGSAPSEDVTSFTFVVDAITFRRANGATVDFLQQPATVDLAALEGATQDLGMEEVATGGFVGATVTLDFTNAACFLAGQSTAASLSDTSGQPLTGLVTVDLDLARAPFFAFARQHHSVELDFDLAPSLTIDAAANAVVVAPALVVRVDRVDARTLCTCGALEGMDASTGTAALDLESEAGEPIGARTVVFDPTTVFHVDGVPWTGAAGLAALAAKPAGTWVECYGAVDPLRERVAAAYVEAGSCTRRGGQDLVDGVIVARSGAAGGDATLTVVGASVAAGGAQQFAGTFTVTAAFATTRVVRAGDAGLFDSDALNVGQAIRAYGTLGGATLDATAASALVRELPTTLFGHAVGAPSGTTLTLALGRVGPLDPSSITWSDGGPTPPDPTQFTLDFSSFGSGLSIVDGSPLIAQVFLAKVADADADATAVAIVDLTVAPALLLLRDRAGGFDVSVDPSPDQLQFTVTGAPGPDEEAALDFGYLGRQALPDTPDPLLVAAKPADVFELRHAASDTVACYVLFDEFEAALAAALAGGAAVRDCTAVGTYDAPTNTLRATSAIVVVE